MFLIKSAWNQVAKSPDGKNQPIGLYGDLARSDLIKMIGSLEAKVARLSNQMLNKKEVAMRAGMTVSWLDNSRSPKACKLRAIGIRYGSTQTSPVRYPLSEVVDICLEDESRSVSQIQ